MVTQEEVEQEILQEMKEQQADDSAEGMFDQMEDTSAWQEAYGAPEPEEKINQHAFIFRSAFDNEDTIKTTFLTEGELGRPLFTVRFLMDMEDLARYYIDPVAKKIGLDPKKDNKIANYFWEKIQNITASGMSNKGFIQNLNVTRKMDMTRKRTKDIPSQFKTKVKR